jgi:hypothetical protein
MQKNIFGRSIFLRQKREKIERKKDVFLVRFWHKAAKRVCVNLVLHRYVSKKKT